MGNKIKWLLKSSDAIYVVYNRVLSAAFKFIGLFFKVDDRLIIFNSFGGAKYDDSPKVMYEYMKNNPKYNSFKIIWAFDKLPENASQDINWVKNNSFRYFKTALKAKYWITNSSIERGLRFKKKKTIYINTWHGSALKKMGYDTGQNTKKLRVSRPDVFYCQSEYDKETFAKAFRYPDSCMYIVGLPRNDELAKVTKDKISLIREKLDIPKNKKVILYAPTFRDYVTNVSGNCLAPPFHVKEWRNKLSEGYVVLFRAHYEVNRVLNIKYDNFVRNVTNYENLNDLLMVADILISDYSSVMIDYSILERPIFSYAYDLDEYSKMRGLYFDLDKVLPNGVCRTEDEVIDSIAGIDMDEQRKKTIMFRDKFVEKYGNAAEFIDKIILNDD